MASTSSSEERVGDKWVGICVKKVFQPFGLFNGQVVAYDKSENLYLVRYEDDDQEELDLSELKEVRALALMTKGARVNIEFNGEYFLGHISKFVATGVQVTFDEDGSRTVIPFESMTSRLSVLDEASQEEACTLPSKENTKSGNARSATGAKKRGAAAEDEPKASTISSSKKRKKDCDPDQNISEKCRVSMAKAEKKAIEIRQQLEEKLKAVKGKKKLAGIRPTKEQVLEVLQQMGGDWPTQTRPNVAEKPVPGMCLGLVYAFTNGLRASKASEVCPEVTKLLTAFVRTTLPEEGFAFSSIQINYNYAARRHVDGNNMGPSYILSLGEHTGGTLWTADLGVINCHDRWVKFNGKAEHETQPFKGTRISIIVFTHNASEELTDDVAQQLQDLGFTKADTTRQRDPGDIAEDDFDKFWDAHTRENPPPAGKGMLAVECAGYACGRGSGWVSFDLGTNRRAVEARKKSIDSTKRKELCEVVESTIVKEVFPKNRVGFHVVELEPDASGALTYVARHRFDMYNQTESESRRFVKWVEKLPAGRVVLICISDTAIAKKRPLEEPVYDALRLLGSDSDMEVIGYRNPFVFIGVKGAKCGEGEMLLDKRAQSKTVLRLDAKVVVKGSGKTRKVSLDSVKNSSISAREECPDRAAEGWIFKNTQRVVARAGKLVSAKRPRNTSD